MSNNTENSTENTLTGAQLAKYSGLSALFAAIMLITVILPAEYNIDPTGMGEKLGLMVFNQNPELASEQTTQAVNMPVTSSVALSRVATPSDATPSVFMPAMPTSEMTSTNHGEQTIEVMVPAGKGVEYKFTMNQYQKLKYEWQTDDTPLYFDLHGEPQGDTTGYFESYAIATVTTMKGSFTAPFSGSHGWYWRNKSSNAVKVYLTFSGEYIEHHLK